MNKRVKIIYIAGFLALIVFFLVDTMDEINAIREVKYSISNLNVDYNANSNQANVSLDIKFTNNSDYQFELQNIHLDVLNDDKTKLGEIQKDKITISKGVSEVQSAVQIDYKKLSINMMDLLSSKQIYVYIVGNVKYKAGMLKFL